jgi:5-dehydro-4-deoxyglucarate dehydratase
VQLRDVLFFPVTPFDREGALAPDVLAKHLEAGMQHEPGGVFVACGTGEYHALDVAEHAEAVRTAVGVVDGRVPVVAGAGGALPHAQACARQAEQAGADGLLVMPPYLVGGPPEGYVRYLDALEAVTDLPLVLYQRGTVRLAPALVADLAERPQVVGFKDGTGDLDLMQRTVSAVRERVGDELMFFNGCPTAELTQAAYRAIGVPLYSSAAFAVSPSLSRAFFRAVEDGDDELRDRLLAAFFRPLVELRDQVPGYAVALIKAGVRATGLDVGGVRPPLVDPTVEHLERFQRLLEVGERIVAEAGA